MTYSKGDRVRHPGKADWGLGEVLEDSKGDLVRIFFVGAGEKSISLKHVQPVKVVGAEAAHPVLNNLKIPKGSSGIKYQSLSESKSYFLEKFPEGFYGERFNREERAYKVRAHEMAVELLHPEALRSLLAANEYSEICVRALKLVNATNLIFPNEKMALKDGLVEPASKAMFAKALYELLHGQGAIKDRFSSFTNVLAEIGADKWTTASYFLFFAQPRDFMFVKPTITQHAAALCGFEISYKPQVNWMTYDLVLQFSRYLQNELADLRPRDMIDVQSFMWCIAPDE